MEIYQNLGIRRPENAGFPAGTVGYPYIISAAQMIPKGYNSKPVLSMELRESGKDLGTVFGYGLIGKEVFNPFIKAMGVKNIDDLVGKNVFAFIPPQHDVAQGLAIID